MLNFETSVKTEQEQKPESWTGEAIFNKENEVLPIADVAKAEGEVKKEQSKIQNWKRAVCLSLTLLAAGNVAGQAIEARAAEAGKTTQIELRASEDRRAAIEQKVADLRNQLEQESLKKKMVYLESVYGDAMKNFLFAIRSNALTLEYFSSAENDNVKAGLADELSQNHDYFWDKKEIVKRAELKRQALKISGFEQLGGFNNESVKQTALEILPPAFINNEDEINYNPTEKKALTFPVAGEANIVGITGMLAGDKHIVTVYKYESIENNPDEMRHVLAHEIGHHNDPQESNRLTMAERVDFAVDITERLLDPERPHSSYVDEVTPGEYQAHKWSKNEVQWRRARELWAESVEKYVVGPAKFWEESPKEAQLVEDWMAKISGMQTEK
jgi:hypothetical protein